MNEFISEYIYKMSEAINILWELNEHINQLECEMKTKDKGKKKGK